MTAPSTRARSSARLADLRTADVCTVLGGAARKVPCLASVWEGAHSAGAALTARAVPGDNLALHRALAIARPGDFLIADTAGDVSVGSWGELMTISAQAAGVVGVALNGATRDVAQLRRLRFPVFAIARAPHPATKLHPGELGVRLDLCGVSVTSGDLVVADDDGVVIVDRGGIGTLLAGIARLRRRERSVARRLRLGERTLDVLDLPRPGPSDQPAEADSSVPSARRLLVMP